MQSVISGIYGMFVFLQVVESSLDIMVSGQEMQNLFFGTAKDIKIIDNGNESTMLKDNLTTYLPPIKPESSEIKLKFASVIRLYYKMYLTTSDDEIMKKPTMEFPYLGRLRKEFIAFKIYFPCTRRKTGVVNLGIMVDFFYDSEHKKKYKTVNLSMRRYCKADPPSSVIKPKCERDCSLYSLRMHYCLSDFVARIKVGKVTDTHLKVRVHSKRIFKRPCAVPILKKNQHINIRNSTLSCNCQPLQEGKRYLIFAVENFADNTLFMDQYSIAYEIGKQDSEANKMFRDFRRAYRTTNCPPPTGYEYFCRRNKKGDSIWLNAQNAIYSSKYRGDNAG